MVSSSYVRHENAPVYGCVRVRPPYTERATYWCCCNECICHECALLFSVRCNIQIWLPPLLLSPSSTYLNRSVCGIARKVDCFIRPGQTFATQIKTKVYHMLWWKWASLRPINRIYFIWKNRKTLGHVGVRAFNQKSAYIKWNNLCAMSSFGLVKTSFYKLSTMFLVYLYVIWISAHTHTQTNESSKCTLVPLCDKYIVDLRKTRCCLIRWVCPESELQKHTTRTIITTPTEQGFRSGWTLKLNDHEPRKKTLSFHYKMKLNWYRAIDIVLISKQFACITNSSVECTKQYNFSI